MKPVIVLHRERKPLNRLGLLSVGLDTVIGQDRCLLGRERPPGLIRPPGHHVQLVAARGVQEASASVSRTPN